MLIQTSVPSGLSIEPLESRRLLAAFVVDTIADGPADPADGLTTLREAVEAAAASPEADTIDFDPTVFSTPQTIVLTEGALALGTGDVTINDSTAGVTVDGDAAGRILVVPGGAVATVNGLVLTNGSAGISDNGTPLDPSDDFALGGGAVVVQGGDPGVLPPIAPGSLTLNGTSVTASVGSLGGGILNVGSLVLNDVIVDGNTSIDPIEASTGSGGGVATLFGTLEVNGGSFTNNTVTDPQLDDLATADGGAMALIASDVLINGSLIDGNIADGRGGGIYSQPTSDGTTRAGGLTMIDVTVSNNSAPNGGGMFVRGAEENPPAPPTVSSRWAGPQGPAERSETGLRADDATRALTGVPDYLMVHQSDRTAPRLFGGTQTEIAASVFEGNTAVETGGGIFLVLTTSDVTSSRFIGNSVTGALDNPFTTYGGGIAMQSADLYVVDSEFSENDVAQAEGINSGAAGAGIGIFDVGISTSQIGIVNSTFALNTGELGAAMAFLARPGGSLIGPVMQVVISQTTITDNSATTAGGGVLADADELSSISVDFGNTILAGNTGLDENDAVIVDNLSLGGTTVEAGAAGVNVFGTDITAGPADIGTDDPGLAPLGFYNGSPTRIAPPADDLSPAFNTADPTFAVNPGRDLEVGTADDLVLTTDQTGLFPRDTYFAPDIGAAEYVIPGDANLDGTVNLSDFLALRRNFGAETSLFADGDFNGDGRVNLSDFLILRRNFGESVVS
jgi:hypothetical protein